MCVAERIRLASVWDPFIRRSSPYKTEQILFVPWSRGYDDWKNSRQVIPPRSIPKCTPDEIVWGALFASPSPNFDTEFPWVRYSSIVKFGLLHSQRTRLQTPK